VAKNKKESAQVRSKSDNSAVFDEIQRLVEATVNGQLNERASADQFEGQDKLMLEGINKLIDAFMAPFNVTAEYVDRISKGDIPDVDRISKGDIPEPITDTYNGDFNEVKNNLNKCIEVMNGLVEGAAAMAKAAAAGELDTRVDAAQFVGSWQAIIQGINDTAEGVVVPLRDIGGALDKMAAGELKSRVTNDYQGDYNVLKVACNELGEQLQGVQEVQNVLQVAIREGKLDARGETDHGSIQRDG